MIPILFGEEETTFTSNGIGSLCDATFCNVTEERNGIFEVELRYPITGALFKYIGEGCYIKAKPNETSEPQIFHIYKSSKPINGQVTFYGEHISYELTGNPIDDLKITGQAASEALNSVLNAALLHHNYRGISDISFRGSTHLSIVSTRAALGGVRGSLLDVYGGEFEFDNFTIKLHNNRGSDTGIIIAYGKNLTDLNQEKNISETYTAIFPYAKYTPETEDGAEAGEITVTLSEKIIHTVETTRPKVLIKDFSELFSEGATITEEALRSKVESWVKTSGYDKPKININVSFAHLWQSPEYAQYAALERVSLCDTVTVIFEELGVQAKAKVIKTTYDTLKEKYVSIDLGDAKSNFADTIKQTTSSIDDVRAETKKAESSAMKRIADAVANATARITGQSGGYVVLNPSNNPQEILIMDTPSIEDAINIWRWNSGGLGHSSNGYDGPYTTAITQDGQIVADFITAGIINGALILADSVQASALSLEYKNSVSNDIDEAAREVSQAFKIADEEVLSSIKQTLTSYSTTTEMQSYIHQTADEITSSVSNTLKSYATTKAMQNAVDSTAQSLLERIEETKSLIEQTADSITLSVSHTISETLEDYSTTEEMQSYIKLTESSITSSVTRILDGYATMGDLNATGNLLATAFTSEIEQLSDKISLVVTSTVNGNVIASASIIAAINNDTSSITISANKINLTAYAKTAEVYNEAYAAAGDAIGGITLSTTNGSTSSTIKINYNGISIDSATVSFTGVVTFSDLENRGRTTINGSNITTGTIAADRINTNELACTKLYAKNNYSGYTARLNGNLGDFGIFNGLADDDDYASSTYCMFGVFNSFPNVNFCIYGNNYMGYDVGTETVWAKGKWDFSAATVNGIDGGSGSSVAVFG